MRYDNIPDNIKKMAGQAVFTSMTLANTGLYSEFWLDKHGEIISVTIEAFVANVDDLCRYDVMIETPDFIDEFHCCDPAIAVKELAVRLFMLGAQTKV